MEISRRRGPFLAALVLAVAALLASCGTVSAFLDLQTALQHAGFSHIKVNLDSSISDGSGLRVEAKGPGGETQAEALDQAAEVTWKEFPRKFEHLQLTIDGQSRGFTRPELQEKFGPRPANLDRKTLAGDTRSIGVSVLVGFAVAFVVAVLVLVLVLVLVRRSKKRKHAAAQAAWAAQAGQYPAGYGYGQQPPPGAYPPPPPVPPAEPPNQNPPGWG